MEYTKGISVIICCYNSSLVIKETLEHLFAQKIKDDILWEIVLINNASTDNTEEVVNQIFSTYSYNCQCRLINEKEAGLIYARNRGIRESKYGYLLYCDDDNYLADNYLQNVYNLMESNSNIGVCGGKGVALIRDIEEPKWFKKYEQCYAIGSQETDNHQLFRLYGAGMCIRKSALDNLQARGFKSLLSGRKGDLLLAGEDTELTAAIKLIGYDLCASDDLLFHHLIGSKRVDEDYLIKMQKGFGISVPVTYFYTRAVKRASRNRSKKSYLNNYFTFIILTFFRFVYYSKSRTLDNRVRYSYNKGILLGVFLLRSEVKKTRKLVKIISKKD